MATGSSDATHRQPSRPLFNNPPSAPLSPASFTTIRQSMKATAECLPKQHSENSIRSPCSSCTAFLRLRVSPRADFARDGFKKSLPGRAIETIRLKAGASAKAEKCSWTCPPGFAKQPSSKRRVEMQSRQCEPEDSCLVHRKAGRSGTESTARDFWS